MHDWVLPRALGVVVDSLLVEVELGVAGIDGHRDGAHSPYSLLQVLGAQSLQISDIYCFKQIDQQCKHLIVIW